MPVEITDPSVQAYDRLALLFEEDIGWDPATKSTAAFIKNLTGLDVCFTSAPVLTTVEPEREWNGPSKCAPLIQAAHRAYDLHIPFALSPEVVWMTILQEVAIHVHLHSEELAHLFTATPGEKQELKVYDESFGKDTPEIEWDVTIPVFRALLREKVPGTLTDEMLPRFTTDTPETRTAMLVTFMDVASDYYDYRGGTMCGIPAFRLNGEASDWEAIDAAVANMKGKFPLLERWLGTLGQVTRKLVAATNGEKDLDFWQSFFKLDNESGGPHVNGWINAFFAHFPQSTTRTEYDWDLPYDDPNRKTEVEQPEYGLRGYYTPLGVLIEKAEERLEKARTKLTKLEADRSVRDRDWKISSARRSVGDCERALRSLQEEGVEDRNARSLKYTISSFPPGLSMVNFTVDATRDGRIPERKFMLISGVIGSEFQGRFLTPKVGWAVAPVAA